jgi:soluble lytic murein transglycosylase
VASKFSLRRALISAGFALGATGVAVGTAALASDPGLGGAQTLQYSYRASLSDSDVRTLGNALEAAKRGDPAEVRQAMGLLSDPLARKIALWALIETSPDGMSYAELEGARRDLAGWPGAAGREAATEKVLEGGGLSSGAVISWFAGADPTTAQGAMALAAAYQATGQQPKAAEVIRHIWRTRSFDAASQQTMLNRFGSALSADDDVAREDMLLYGAQGDATHQLAAMLPADQRTLAEARMAIREGAANADSLIDALPAALRNAPGLAYEEALRAERRGDDAGALALIPNLPTAIPDPEAQSRMWKLRKPLVIAALKVGDARGAYRAAAGSGCDQGADGAEAEFYAGWIALTRLKDPHLADEHFAKLQEIGQSPITASRALYWRGRAAEAEGDPMNAQLFYASAAKYPTAFYGQLGAAKAGQTTITVGSDPTITAADRARFDDREEVRAVRMLAEIGAKDTFTRFVLGLAETLPTDTEAAQLVDLVRGEGDQYLSMKVVRAAAKHGYVLPERGYPLHATPGGGSVEVAYVLGITRQESGFDPHVRSPAGATGMMQLMPATARSLSHKYGYGEGSLEDADYNMQLGSAYLGQLMDQFGGSYVMATAAYNAGPGRPTEWTSFCGDPRMSSTDPADYIECIPFSETRDYVMRVMEGMQVYRARLAGGTGKLTLPADLKRGGYGYGYSSQPTALSAAAPSPLTSSR